MVNNYNKPSVINLNFKNVNNKTCLKDYYFTAPFKVINPFEVENGFLRVILMTTSAGIMAGDFQQMTIDLDDNCKSEIISQSYEKIHKMEQGKAVRETEIKVGKDSILNYNPQPTIPYADSAFENVVNIHLKDNTSKLIYNEILSSGRVHYGESFQYKFFKNAVNIYEDGKLIYRDTSLYDPKLFNMEGFGLYEGFTHFSNQVICNFENKKELIDKIRVIIEEVKEKENIVFGVSDTQHGDVVVRVLGNEGNLLENICKKIADICI